MTKDQVAFLHRVILVQFEGAEEDAGWQLLLEDCGVKSVRDLFPELDVFEKELAHVPVFDVYTAVSKAMFLIVKAVADKAGIDEPLAQKIASTYVYAIQPDLILQLKSEGYL